MSELAELGRIAKAQQMAAQPQQQKDSHLGRKLALGGLGTAGLGGAVVGHGFRANLKDTNVFTDDNKQMFRMGSDGVNRPIKPMQMAGAKRMIGGATAMGAGKLALGAAPVVGLTNMYNKRRNQKLQAKQQGPVPPRPA